MRDFHKTAEPSENRAPRADGNRFVIQQHAARRLHDDFTLELDGVVLSWSVPKGPSFSPTEGRLAVRTEDHPLDYANFEGIIPDREYCARSDCVWDRGTWTPEGDAREGIPGTASTMSTTRRSRRPRGGPMEENPDADDDANE